MASTSYDSASHTSFDVFLSFRGKDTRDSFADHLYAALKRAGIVTFRDNDEIIRGQELGPEIVKAIRESKDYIVVLSENYANSRWCLTELVLILEQRRNFNRFVLPVFYQVEPSDVRNLRKSFAIEVNYGGEGSKWTEDNVNRWKAALNEVANLTGMAVSGPETDFIKEVVDTIVCESDLKPVSTPTHLTGMENRAQGINTWLKSEQSSDEVLAVCGMGGIGKTTLAQYIYATNKKNFESTSFLEVTRDQYKSPHDLLQLQNHILMDILDGRNTKISTVFEGTQEIQKALKRKRVLIVLDDIDDHDQVCALLGTKAFHTQSKIIITTRLRDVRSWCQSLSWGCQLHGLQLLNDHESLELLSFHAFGSKIPMEGLEELAVELAGYCSGHPLALKVLGSSLSVSAEDPSKSSIIENWRSTLNSLKGDLDCSIQAILRRSFDSLPRHTHRELFLHVALFFVGEYKDDVVKILGYWHASSGIEILINRCLFTVSPSNKIMMHQLLQEMGRTIVCEESKEPAKRSRVWHDDESLRVLGKRGGSETIEALTLDKRKLMLGTRSKMGDQRERMDEDFYPIEPYLSGF